MNNRLEAVNEYTGKELVDLAQAETPTRYRKRLSTGIPRVNNSAINYDNGSAVMTFTVGDHEVMIILKEFLQLVAHEVVEKVQAGMTRREAVRIIKTAITLILEDGDVLVDCSCPDYKYRFNWVAKQYGYAARDRIQKHNYKPDQTNPNLRGGICKHITRVLSRASYWYDTAGRKLINDLMRNKEFVELLDLAMEPYLVDDRDYDEDTGDRTSYKYEGVDDEVDERVARAHQTYGPYKEERDDESLDYGKDDRRRRDEELREDDSDA